MVQYYNRDVLTAEQIPVKLNWTFRSVIGNKIGAFPSHMLPQTFTYFTDKNRSNLVYIYLDVLHATQESEIKVSMVGCCINSINFTFQ